jgi:CBS domain containing-hemolysin-like protein
VEACSDATVAEVVAVCAERGVSRVPVRGSASGRGEWRGVFSVYDVIFELPERRWGSERARDYLRALPSVSEDEGMRGVLSVAKTTGSPILAVSADGSGAVGLVTVGDVAKALFEGDGKGEG